MNDVFFTGPGNPAELVKKYGVLIRNCESESENAPDYIAVPAEKGSDIYKNVDSYECYPERAAEMSHGYTASQRRRIADCLDEVKHELSGDALCRVMLLKYIGVSDRIGYCGERVDYSRLNTEEISSEQYYMLNDPEIFDMDSCLDDMLYINIDTGSFCRPVKVDDIVYICSADPGYPVTHKCIVNKTGIQKKEIWDRKYYKDEDEYSEEGDFAEIQLLCVFKGDNSLRIKELMQEEVPVLSQGGAGILGKEQIKALCEAAERQEEENLMTGEQIRIIGPSIERKMLHHDALLIEDADDDTALALARANEKIVFTTTEKKTDIDCFDRCVLNYAKRRASGICQLCDSPAPFCDLDGTPYLEPYHILGQIDDGGDTVINVAMLCPNCHKKMELINSYEDRIKLCRMCGNFTYGS